MGRSRARMECSKIAAETQSRQDAKKENQSAVAEETGYLLEPTGHNNDGSILSLLLSILSVSATLRLGVNFELLRSGPFTAPVSAIKTSQLRIPTSC